MAEAVKEAGKAKGYTAPNPPVGAVIVKNGKIIGRGYHKKAGSDHAEVAAIKKSIGDLAGSTIYITLEPCNHTGRTGPCTEAIIKAGISKVVIGAKDRSPKKGQKGITALKRAGIEVLTGILEKSCNELVAGFTKHSQTGLPLVTIKCAMTLDGRIGSSAGKGEWFTSDDSRRLVHTMRTESTAVMVGIGTLLADDPRLDVRYGRKRRNPVRIVLDSNLRIPYKCNLIKSVDKVPTLVITTSGAGKQKIVRLEKMGLRVKVVAKRNGRVDLKKALKFLGDEGITDLMVETGSILGGALMKENLADRAVFFYAPIVAGGTNYSFAGKGLKSISTAPRLKDITVGRSGDDILVTGRFGEW